MSWFHRDKSLHVKFDVELDVHDLNNVPLLNAVIYCKWKLKSGGSSSGTTKPMVVRENTVHWAQGFRFDCDMSMHKDTRELKSCVLRISVRQETKGGTDHVRLGVIEADLAMYADKQDVTRRFLLQESTMNSSLSIGLKMKQTAGDPTFKCPVDTTRPGGFNESMDAGAHSPIPPTASISPEALRDPPPPSSMPPLPPTAAGAHRTSLGVPLAPHMSAAATASPATNSDVIAQSRLDKEGETDFVNHILAKAAPTGHRRNPSQVDIEELLATGTSTDAPGHARKGSVDIGHQRKGSDAAQQRKGSDAGHQRKGSAGETGLVRSGSVTRVGALGVTTTSTSTSNSTPPAPTRTAVDLNTAAAEITLPCQPTPAPAHAPPSHAAATSGGNSLAISTATSVLPSGALSALSNDDDAAYLSAGEG